MTRGDLRARLGTSRGRGVQTFYLLLCSAFLFLSLPPEIGRFELRDAHLLLALLAAQTVAVTYLTSAFASGEVALDGEKALPDLVLSAFSTAVITAGKVLSGALYALYLVLIAAPLVVFAVALRGAPLAIALWAGAVSAAVGAAAGAWGAWLAGRFASEFTRSIVHWSLLGAIFVGTALLPPPWSLVNPIRALDGLTSGVAPALLLAVVAGYLAVALAGAAAIAAHVRAARSEAAPL
ncbi:MAG: hypothetical protein QN183_07065 [Armatimonadota bacterium]|nr:hypothetical protein [Armatimonadota bacterium]MDR7532901.1 hypothetical protein [Armatimonadota bacterium]MDR7536108.1 hypothetical protein [Armatimonadota bacterium]